MVVGTASIVTATLVIGLLSALYFYIQRWKNYWNRRNVPTVGNNIVYGAFKDTMTLKESINDAYRNIYEKNKNLKYLGTFFLGRPTLVVQDNEIVKEILVKDFTNFNSHGLYNDTENDPLAGHLFNLDGAKWKNMRSKLSVTFTSGKMKYMFDTMQQCIRRFHVVVDKELDTNGNVVDMKDKLACLGTDIIASVAFGIEVNSIENPKAEFREVGRKMFTPSNKEFARILLMLNAHWFMRLFNIKIINSHSHKFLTEMVKNTVAFREKNGVVRNDFLNMMMQLKNKGCIDFEGKESAYEKDTKSGEMNRVSIDEVAAQVFIFFAAGFETTSTTTAFTLYELSLHKDIQKKVQEECDKVLRASGGQVTYEAIQSMTYTDQVIHETLRIFPVMGALIRSTTNDCTLPGTDVQLEKNTSIAIPIQGFHMDPQYFPDPERFDPERFSEEQRASRPPYVYMPFGDGPRICIGMRFALVQVKSVLLGLFSRYNFDLAKDVPVPIILDKRTLVPSPTKLDFVISKRESK